MLNHRHFSFCGDREYREMFGSDLVESTIATWWIVVTITAMSPSHRSLDSIRNGCGPRSPIPALVPAMRSNGIMYGYKRLFLLIFIMACVSFMVVGIAIYALYLAAFDEQRHETKTEPKRSPQEGDDSEETTPRL